MHFLQLKKRNIDGVYRIFFAKKREITKFSFFLFKIIACLISNRHIKYTNTVKGVSKFTHLFTPIWAKMLWMKILTLTSFIWHFWECVAIWSSCRCWRFQFVWFIRFWIHNNHLFKFIKIFIISKKMGAHLFWTKCWIFKMDRVNLPRVRTVTNWLIMPSPSAFLPTTWNSYVLPGVRPLIVTEVLPDGETWMVDQSDTPASRYHSV